MNARYPTTCPHCFAKGLNPRDLDMHLRFTCPVIRPPEAPTPTSRPASFWGADAARIAAREDEYLMNLDIEDAIRRCLDESPT
jgi:hypothetical protein